MANKKKEAPAEKKQELSAGEKAKLIGKVREKLATPELQKLFDEYCGLKQNPALVKRLQDNNTDWEKALTDWKKTKEKKAGGEKKGKAISNPLTFLSKIEEDVKKDSFDSLQSAIGYCQELLKVLKQKQEAKKQAKIATIKKEMKEREALLKELEGVQDDKAGE